MNGKRKCTVFMEKRARRHGRHAAGVWLAALVIGASLCGGVPVALADMELGHDGLTGRHRLADMYDSPGAVCDVVLPGFDSLGETWLRVNPPVMFARDRTPGLDEQYVGWQATVSAMIEGRDTWGIVRRSEIRRALANDDLATYFDGQGWLAA